MLTGRGANSQYMKVDLHVHTPASSCYVDYMEPRHPVTHPQEIVKAARAAGLAGIAIVDHNTVQGIDELREVAQGEPVVFPGIEISAQGGHVLGLFPEGTPAAHIHRLVEELGFSREQQGHGHCECSWFIGDVLTLVVARGGITIASHIDRRPKGFVATEALTWEEKRQVLSSPYLSAVEITIPQDKKLWMEGRMPGYTRPIPCVQGSDAHAPEEIARRPIYLLLPRLDWEGLRLALQEAPSRLRFPHEVEVPPGN